MKVFYFHPRSQKPSADIWTHQSNGYVWIDTDSTNGFSITDEQGDEYFLIQETPLRYQWTDYFNNPVSNSLYLRKPVNYVMAKDVDNDGLTDLVVVDSNSLAYPFKNAQTLMKADSNTTIEENCFKSLPLSNFDFGKSIQFFTAVHGDQEVGFISPNCVSNELFQNSVADRLKQSGGAYIGVGPYQNYTYIAQTKPEVAFLIDIRPTNIVQHLMAKVLIQESQTPTEFLWKLFSKEGVPPRKPMESVLDIINSTKEGDTLEKHQIESFAQRICHAIEKDYSYHLSKAQKETVKDYLNTFAICETHITYNGCIDKIDMGFPIRRLCREPLWEDIILFGVAKEKKFSNHWLGNQHSFDIVKRMHEENRIIPILGDFGGHNTFAALSQVLQNWDLTVNYFYTSNVEMWLLMEEAKNGTLKRFYDNVARLPLNHDSSIIRALWKPQEDMEYVGYGPKAACHEYPMGIVSILEYLNEWRDHSLTDISKQDYLNANLPYTPIVFLPYIM